MTLTTPAIYTTEPMITRALGAEIRNNPVTFTKLLESRAGIEEGTLKNLKSITCEGPSRLDLYLQYEDAHTQELFRVGIEAKFQHEITDDQLMRQRPKVDVLFLLVLDPINATGHQHLVDGVLTWNEVLATFTHSRITQADITSIPTTKLQIEGLLHQLALEDRFPTTWTVWYSRGGSGMSSVEFSSPTIPDGRQLRGQIQVKHRGSLPSDSQLVRMEYHLGVSVEDTEADFPDPSSAKNAPSWVEDLKILYDVVLHGRLDELMVSTHKPGRDNGEFGVNRKPLLAKFLTERTWLGQGYRTWALGPRSTGQPLSELPRLADVAVEVMTEWHEALRHRSA